ncbi:MAG: L,D-transpeptidase [Polyangiaceae bacterium]|nr:L,D-transpeptidase [Polyangiaceae bacterium]
MRASAWPLAIASVGVASRAHAAGPPLTLPEDARSVFVVRNDEPVFAAPEERAPRRGSARADALLPLYAARRGGGCAGTWLQVGTSAWICDTHVRVTAEPPIEVPPEPPSYPLGLPHRYFWVGPAGSFAYARLRSAEAGEPDRQLEPGFALAILEVRDQPGTREPFGFAASGQWVPMRDLAPVRPKLFHGEEIVGGQLDLGWVVSDEAPVFRAPAGARAASDAAVRFERVSVLERRRSRGAEWVRVAADRWLRARDLAVPTPAPLPDGLLPGERWIDVDLASQTLTAYEGERAVFATLVSTGKGRAGTETATPRGNHRVWVKLESHDMDNLEDPGAGSYYAIQRVPFVMFFLRGYGLHGTFWHERFGAVRSHGCVNLAPLDAQRLFHWTSPKLPPGWSAAFPTPYEPGTLVRVR